MRMDNLITEVCSKRRSQTKDYQHLRDSHGTIVWRNTVDYLKGIKEKITWLFIGHGGNTWALKNDSKVLNKGSWYPSMNCKCM